MEEAEDRHTTHYLSTLLADLPQLTQQCLAAQVYPADILTTTGYLPEGNRCILALQAEGVYLDHFGLPHNSPPTHPLNLLTTGNLCIPRRHGTWRRLLLANRLQQLPVYTYHPFYNTAGLLSSQWLTATDTKDTTPLNNSEFHTCVLDRFGMPVMPVKNCAHRPRNGTEPCNQPADAHGRHACNCMTGGRRNAVHHTCCNILNTTHRALQLSSHREVNVFALSKPSNLHPRVDIDLTGNNIHDRLLYDFTLVDQPPEKLQTAERDKTEHYKTPCNPHAPTVHGLAMNLQGHVGPNLTTHLQHLQQITGDIAHYNPTSATPHTFYARTTTALSLALARFKAAAISTA